MGDSRKYEKLHQIPVLYVRGDNFIVGYTIGRQFKSLIEDNLSKSEYLKHSLLPVYETEEGKTLYRKNLELCKRNFPQYVHEIQGMAQGANVPFHELFLLNLEVFFVSRTEVFENTDQEGNGCSSILCNGDQLMLAHNEDIGPELINNVFIVSAEILDNNGEKVEKFTTLTYAGCLPGFTMGYNEHGFIYSVNTLCPLDILNEKSPRSFISRALLRARNLEDVVEIMKDKGTGISDGFSLNACFANPNEDKTPQMYNIEVCPNKKGDESKVDVFEVKNGETYVHCNMYLRMKTAELEKAAVRSGHRHRAIDKHPEPKTADIVRNVLSDRSDPDFPVFRCGEKIPDNGVTIVVGVFDITNRLWNIYSDKPNSSNPIAVLPLQF